MVAIAIGSSLFLFATSTGDMLESLEGVHGGRLDEVAAFVPASSYLVCVVNCGGKLRVQSPSSPSLLDTL